MARTCERRDWAKWPVTWGERLQLRIGQRHLQPIVNNIRAVTGDFLGSSRNTYAALFDLPEPPAPHTRAYERAYLLLLAAGQDPAPWGIDETNVSPLVKGARDLLLVRSGCTWTKTAA